MRGSVLLSVCVILAACVGRTRGPETPRLNLNLEATHRLDDVAGGHGSAVVIDAENGLLLTCSHVATEGHELRMRISVNGGPASVYRADVVARDAKLDLAVVHVARRFEADVIIASDADAHVLDAVYNLGFPQDLGEVGSKGVLKAVRHGLPRYGLKNVLLAEFQGAPGTSGSGLFLARDGRLIGLMRSIIHSGPPDHRTVVARIVVQAGDIRAFLDRAGIRYRTR